MEDYEIRGKVDQFVKWFGRIDKLCKWAGHLYLLVVILILVANPKIMDREEAIVLGAFIFWGLYQVTRILSFGVAWSVVEMTMNSRAALLMGVNTKEDGSSRIVGISEETITIQTAAGPVTTTREKAEWYKTPEGIEAIQKAVAAKNL